jgi:hypothetical protein
MVAVVIRLEGPVQISPLELCALPSFRHSDSEAATGEAISSPLRWQQQLIPELNNLLGTTSLDDFDAG